MCTATFFNSHAWDFNAASYAQNVTAAVSVSMKSCGWAHYPCHKVRFLSTWLSLKAIDRPRSRRPGHCAVPAPKAGALLRDDTVVLCLFTEGECDAFAREGFVGAADGAGGE